jgi:hypothetical protein
MLTTYYYFYARAARGSCGLFIDAPEYAAPVSENYTTIAGRCQSQAGRRKTPRR